MPCKHADVWDGSEYPHVHGDHDEPDVWEKEGFRPRKKASIPQGLEPDTRADFHGDEDEPDVWEKEGYQPQRFDV